MMDPTAEKSPVPASSSTTTRRTTSSSTTISLFETRLPEILVEEILGFLTFTERRRLLSLSKTLWKLRPMMDFKTRHLQLQPEEGHRLIRDEPFQSETRIRHMFGVDLSASLISLTLDHNCANDAFLHIALVELELFPNLQAIRVRACDHLTDFGLDRISRSVAAAEALQVVDITFCSHTSYAGTFPLRQRVTNLKILRRQPEWLDGRFKTPFGRPRRGGRAGTEEQQADEPSTGGEIHTYYCDGSFQFNRDSQSNGFVTQLYPWDDDFLGDKLQYNNFRAPMGWPQWTQFCYRPGVCLLRLPPPNTEQESSTSALENGADAGGDEHCQHTVLVGQYMRGLRAPTSRRLMERAKDLVPLGQSRYFDRTTEELVPTPPDENDTAATASNSMDNLIMISRMRILPLVEPDHPMPPASLVQACHNTCQGLQSFGRVFLQTQEERLGHLLSGGDGGAV